MMIISSLLEKLTVALLVKIFPTFYRTLITNTGYWTVF
jgi:hypothetical protein